MSSATNPRFPSRQGSQGSKVQGNGQTGQKSTDCELLNMPTLRSTFSLPTDVYFDRSLNGFTEGAMPRAKSAQLKLEHYYKVAVDSAIERNTRRVELERHLQSETMMSEERKNRQLHQLGKKESTFLRLRRTKLGLDDFRTVKVIGKGAFGEVRKTSATWTIHLMPCIYHNYRSG